MEKKTKKILLIIIAILFTLLLINTQSIAATNNRTFDRIANSGTFALNNLPDNNYYELAWKLLNDGDVSGWTPDKTVNYFYAKNGNDGYWIVGGGRSSGTDFVRNVYCTEADNSISTGTGSTMKVIYKLEIEPNSISLTTKSGTVTKTVTSSNKADFKTMNKLAYVLYYGYNTKVMWGADKKSARSAQGYVDDQAANIKQAMKNIGFSGFTFGKVTNKGSYWDNPYLNGKNELAEYVSNIYSAGNKYYYKATVYYMQQINGRSQSRIVFKAEKVKSEEQPITINFQKIDQYNRAVGDVTIQLSAADNVKYINDNKQTVKIKSNSENGKFDAITVMPKKDNGTIKLNIEELIVPDDVNKFEASVIGLKYKEGKVTEVISKKFIASSSVDSTGKIVTIQLKNDRPKKPKIEVEKIFTENTQGDKNSFAQGKLNSANQVTFDVILEPEIDAKIVTSHNSIKVTGNSTKQTKSISLGNDRKIEIKDISGEGLITVKETKSLEGFEMAGTVKFRVKSDGKGGYKVSKISGTTVTKKIEDGNGYAKIENKEIKIDERTIKLKKVDEEGNTLSGIKFNLTIFAVDSCIIDGRTYNAGTDGNISISNIATDSNGEIKIKIQDEDLNKIVKVKAQEVSNPLYEDLTRENEFDFESGKKTQTWKIVNTPKPYSLTLQKADKLGHKLGKDYKFKITIDNAKKIQIDKKYLDEDKHSGLSNGTVTLEDTTIIYAKTDDNGQIKIDKIWAKGIESDITVKEYAVGNTIFANKLTASVEKTVSTTGTVKFESDDTNTITASGTTLTFIEKTDDITIDMTKIDEVDKKGLEGAKFDVTIKAGTKTLLEAKDVTTNEVGKLIEENEIKFNVNDYLDKEITVNLVEKEAPEGYALPEDPNFTVVFKYKYNSNNDIVYEINSEKTNCNASFSGKTLKIEIPNKKYLNLELVKKDSLDNASVEGAEFNIKTEGVYEYYYDEKKVTSNDYQTATNYNGVFELTNIVPAKDATQVKITVTETKAPYGLALMDPESITVVWNKDTTGKFVLDASSPLVTYDEEDNRAILNVVDRNAIEELNIAKTDSVTGEKLANTEFKLEFENIKELKVHKDCVVGVSSESDYVVITNIKDTTFKTNNDGLILLKDLILENKEAKVKITETKRPDAKDGSYYYDEIDQSVYFNFKYSEYGAEENGLEITGPYLENGTKLKQGSVTKEVTELVGTTKRNYSLDVEFKNVPLMDLAGQVWLDEQKNEKAVEEADGKNNDGRFLPGVNVYLFKQENGALVNEPINKAVTSGKPDEGEKFISTDPEAGKYTFIGLESPRADYTGSKTTKLQGYIIKFEYNGIEFDSTIKGGDSKAFETNGIDNFSRDKFNTRFTTITKDGSYDNTPLSYDYKANETIATSDLKGTIDGINPASAEKDFKVRADTDLCTGTDKKVDYGMRVRFFDLKLDMVINSAKLTINDKETTYGYDEIKVSEEQKNNTDQNETVDLKLYDADYRYRINDYATNPNQMTEEDLEDKGLIEDNNNLDKQLRAFVTYEVAITNQSNIDSKVNELAYYYDSHYKFVSAIDEKGNTVKFEDNATLPQISGKKSAIVSEFGSNLGRDEEYRQVLYFTFEIIRDEHGALPAPIDTAEGMKFANIVEIISYSTTSGGYVDADSCPGNGAEQYNSNKLWEDDTYGAKALRVIVDKGRVRTIEGNVFDDLNKDGILKDENGINDVIVQLIELRKITEPSGNIRYVEGIWQEAITGNETVKIRNNTTGVTDGKYKNGVTTQGSYKFTGFIPGNYIIRFIYGDGLYRIYYFDETGALKDEADINANVANNIKKYNGQDYQSTKDPNYKAAEYTDKINESKKSVARDNENRRLQVIAYSTTIDKAKWDALEGKTNEMLASTWMCAETSTMNVNIDESEQNSTHTSNEPIFVTALTPSLEFTGSNIKFNNVNFGLALRPQTKLELEKHITGLKIQTTGTGTQAIVDAKTSIDKLLAGNTTTEGLNSNLSIVLAERANRGFWKVETAVEELGQSADLKVEYTYVIKNVGDENYLSNGLINKYEELTKANGDTSEYAKYLKNTAAKDIRNATKSAGYNNKIGTYLGEYYYTFNKGSNDKEVESRVETINDYINNSLNFINDPTKETYSGEDFKTANTDAVNMTYYNVDGIAATGGKDIKTVIENTTSTHFLTRNNTDYEKQVVLSGNVDVKEISNEKGLTIATYLGEIVKYTDAAGRRDMTASPENLGYVNSEDNEMTLDAYRYELDGKVYYSDKDHIPAGARNVKNINEIDEFWGESIILIGPTGEDKAFPTTLVITITSSVILLGAGIFLIKKYAIKK